MIHGPRKSRELTAQAIQIRETEKLTWREIAERLDVSIDWLKHRRLAVPNPPRGLLQHKTCPANLDRAAALRAQGLPWKLVGRQMGIDWHTLARAIYLRSK